MLAPVHSYLTGHWRGNGFVVECGMGLGASSVA